MDWETLFTNNIILAETYFISDNQLVINCRNENKLFFDFVGNCVSTEYKN